MRRLLLVLTTASVMACPLAQPFAAPTPAQAAAPAQATTDEALWLWSWRPSTVLLAQGAGALVGFATYSVLVAPQAVAAGGMATVLAGRIMATALAAAGAVVATYIYDVANGQPLDHAYFWHRGGFVVGVAAGIAVFGVLGYPGGSGADWLGWAANRGALLGTGLLGARAMDLWYSGQ